MDRILYLPTTRPSTTPEADAQADRVAAQAPAFVNLPMQTDAEIDRACDLERAA